ncbi:hypothetical protein ABZX12_38510 [Kribbella sp. NPDC003505]|uniref:hypothetical protein n=1 Tax=Kribbella sp. NPDC003505 TaxID=3154448 RepID=UPI0033ACBEB7
MSESSQEGAGVRARYSRWRATSRGRKTLKAAYAQAARDVKRMDPAVRERIGRANMTQSDLQQLASLHVEAQMRPDRYAGVSERLGQRASDRLQAAGPAPRQPRVSRTRNPVRRLARRYSRWGRNERRGTKALKAALTQAAKDIKRTDPSVLQAIGRSTLNSADLAALASSRMDEVFRPEGRFQGVPGQQNGAGRQGQGIQSRDAVRQTPQQSEQVAQRIAALQQSILESQQQMLTLMEENNRLQAEMRQLLEARVQQLQQENAGTDPALEPGRDQQREGVNQLEPGTGQDLGKQGRPPDDNVRLDNPVIQPAERPAGELGEATPESGQRPAVGDQAENGERPGVGETGVGEGTGPGVGDGGEPQVAQAPAEDWTLASETQGEWPRTAGAAAAVREQAGADPKQPAQADPALTAQADQPGVGGQQPGTNPRRRGVGQVPQQQGSAAGENSSAKLDAKFAQGIAFRGDTPLNSVSPQHTDRAVRGGTDDANRRQRTTPGTGKNTPSGKDGR